MTANKLAIVVQRCHPSVTGGSEALAWHYAVLLRDVFEIDILTTTTTDAISWKDELAAGVEESDGITIRRFKVVRERGAYWFALLERLKADVRRNAESGIGVVLDAQSDWNIGLQREFIAKQGPDAPELSKFIAANQSSYDCIIFVTYLYPTSYFGIEAASGHPNIVLVPTLHDEAVARLSAYRGMARRCRSLMWNADAERRLSFMLWGSLAGSVVGMAIDCGLTTKRETQPYILYSGRVDHHKGCGKMFESFMRFKQSRPASLALKLTGTLAMEVPKHPDIQFLGFVSAEEKKDLMRNAIAFVMPSPYESFSIATLEAMAQEVPVLANADSEVVADHVTASGGGLLFQSDATFLRQLGRLVDDSAMRATMGEKGRQYVLNNYTESIVRARLMDAITVT